MDTIAFQAKPSKAVPNKRATLDRITSAARCEFVAKGLAQARVDDIAHAAGVTKQLVYHYFRSKEELFGCVLEDSAALAMAELLALEIDHLAPRDALRALLNAMSAPYCDGELSTLAQEGVRYHANHSGERNSFIAMAPQLHAKMRHTLERGIADGDFRPDLDPPMVLAMAALASTSAYLSPYTVSTLCGLDVAGRADAHAWRGFAVDFVLSAVERVRSTQHPLSLPVQPIKVAKSD